MAAQQVGREETGQSITTGALLRATPQLFAIPVGLAGLAGAWRIAAASMGAPVAVANLLYVAAAAVAAVLCAALVAKLTHTPQRVLAELAQPDVAPFYALAPLSGMLIALGGAPYARDPAAVLFCACFAAAWLFAAWQTGQWLARPHQADLIHPGYFLPAVGGGMVGAEGAARLGGAAMGWMSFGAAAVCWALLGPVVLRRLVAGPPLPAALRPTLAILLAPPAIAGNAYFALSGGARDAPALMLAGFAALMALAQLRLVPLYRAAPFAPSFWSFTFPCAAFTSYALRWLAPLGPAAAAGGGALLLLATALVGAVAARSLVALRRGEIMV